MSITDFRARLHASEIPESLVRILSGSLAINAAVTGWDYIHSPPKAAVTLKMVERLASLHTWGVLFIVAGGMLALGLILRRHALVWLGHLLCSGMYVAFTVATAQAVWEFTHSPLGQAAGSFWRAVSMSAAITVTHVVLCYARGPIPRRGDDQ